MEKSVDINKTLCEAVVRADVYTSYDPINHISYFRSMNEESALTDEEKDLITGWFTIKLPDHKVVFCDDNRKEGNE